MTAPALVAADAAPTRITVRGAVPYDVVIGLGLVGELAEAVAGASKVAIIHPPTLRATAEAIRDELETAYPTLHLIGRNGMHRYNNQDHAMMTAMLTVQNIIAGKRVYDTWCVNEDAEYHEAGDEGAEQVFAPVRQQLSEDQAAALASVREVPARIGADTQRAA